MPDPLPLYLNVDGVYAAKHLAQPWADVVSEGVIYGGAPAGLDPLKVAPVAPAGMAVEVAAGAAWVKNDAADDTSAYFDGGLWRVSRPTSLQVPVDAADATNPRIDRLVLEVLDQQFGGAADLGRLRLLKGTPAASPAAPAEPRSAITLALVTVPAAATSIVAGNIADQRPAAIGAGRVGANDYAYQEFTGTLNVTATTEAAAQTVISAGAVVYPAGAAWVEFFAPDVQPANEQYLVFTLFDGATALGRLGIMQAGGTAVYIRMFARMSRRVPLTAGSHTLIVKAHAQSAAGTVRAGSGGPNAMLPAFVRVRP